MRPIVDLASDSRLIEPTARLLMDTFPNRTEEWQDLESAREEVIASLGPDRISRVLADESGLVIGWIGGISSYGGRAFERHPLVVSASHRQRGPHAAISMLCVVG